MFNLFSKLKEIEPATFYISLSYFLLLFGYKLFSLYYPLFLVAQGFSFAIIGSMYLLIYITIAVASPIMNFQVRKYNPVKLLALAIIGYGAYALGMIFSRTVLQFAVMQVLLGISSALYNISARTILISSRPKNYDRSFAYFYSAPLYSEFLGPLIGGIILWKFNFTGVFTLSLLVCLFSSVFCYLKLRRFKIGIERFDINQYFKNYRHVFKLMDKFFIVFLTISFALLLLTGVYRVFFVLFLQDLGLVRNQVIMFIIAYSFVSIPISWFLARVIGRLKSGNSISYGSIVSGLATSVIGWITNVFGIFCLFITKFVGELMGESGKSGLLSRRLVKYKEEAATIDTVLGSSAVAIGVLIGGLVVSKFGFGLLFSMVGVFVLLMGILGLILSKKKSF